MPDPKLKEAMAEIQAVLKKFDIGAVVVLGSQTHQEFLREYCPSWSCIRFEDPNQDGSVFLRVKALRKDYPSADAHKKVLNDSVGMICGMYDCCIEEAAQLHGVMKMLGSKLVIEHMMKEER